MRNLSTDRNVALLAGGVGLTPVMSIIRTMVDEQDQRTVYVFIPPGERLFRPELEELTARIDNFWVFPVLHRPILGHTFTTAIHNPAEWNFFICGPESMAEDCKAALSTLSVPSNQIFIEQFKVN